MMSMRRRIAGLDPDQIRAIPKEEMDLPVTQQDLVDAAGMNSRTVSRDQLDKYENWIREFSSV